MSQNSFLQLIRALISRNENEHIDLVASFSFYLASSFIVTNGLFMGLNGEEFGWQNNIIISKEFD